MNESTWNRPLPLSHHQRIFSNLIDLHRITRDWLRALGIEGPAKPHEIQRVFSPEIKSRFMKLDSLMDDAENRALEHLIPETSVESFLTRLHYTVWAVQGWTLQNLFEKTDEPERPALLNLLEQSSWKTGRQIASRKWQDTASNFAQAMPNVVSAIKEAPLMHSDMGQGFIVERLTSTSVSLSWLKCPHTLTVMETQSVVETLCHLHHQVIRGYLYALNPALRSSREAGVVPNHSCCRLHFHFSAESL